MRRKVWFIAIAIVLFVVQRPAIAAQGIDCANDTAADEQAVCRDPGLARLDMDLAELFGQAVALYGKNYENPVRRSQREWLGRRRLCGSDTSCLQQVYSDRIQQLRDFLAPPAVTPPPPPPVVETPRPPPVVETPPPATCKPADVAGCITQVDPVVEKRGTDTAFLIYRFENSCTWAAAISGEDSTGKRFDKTIGPGGTAAVECQSAGTSGATLCTGLRSWSARCQP